MSRDIFILIAQQTWLESETILFLPNSFCAGSSLLWPIIKMPAVCAIEESTGKHFHFDPYLPLFWVIPFTKSASGLAQETG